MVEVYLVNAIATRMLDRVGLAYDCKTLFSQCRRALQLKLGASVECIPQFQTHHQMLVTELGMQGLWMVILVGNILGGVVKTSIVLMAFLVKK
ncbi:hypothetical protein A2U01_0007535, partial [Trifolium medium]|nr:hypothetical protein [Trifolium medium]